MPTNIEKRLRSALGAVHPRYDEARRLGPRALRYLQSMLDAPREPLAPRAAYLAAWIGGARGLEVTTLACGHPSPRVRISAAQGTRHLERSEAIKLLKFLMTDPDKDVVLTAVQRAKKLRSPDLEDPLRRIAKHHPDRSIRRVARAGPG